VGTLLVVTSIASIVDALVGTTLFFKVDVERKFSEISKVKIV
jgi:hypothetical protein